MSIHIIHNVSTGKMYHTAAQV